MAIDATKWQVNTDKTIEYTGGAHGTATTNYITVLELYRWLMDLADDDEYSDGTDDYMDIVTLKPSDKKFDTIIQLVNGYTLEDTTTPASEYLYQGSIIEGTGGTEKIYDGMKIVGNAGVTVNVIQDEARLTNDFWNNVENANRIDSTATVDTGGTTTNVVDCADTSVLTAGDYVSFHTTTDESYLIDSIIADTSITLTETVVTGPTSGQSIYFVTRGINADATVGVACQFMVAVRTSGADIDNRALICNTREWYSTFSEFRVPGTGRGENTVPLRYEPDLNNTTAYATIDALADISNTEGYGAIDMDANSVDEYYYSEWDKGGNTINVFYEWFKRATMAKETDTLYGLPGEEFRGITHSIGLQAAPAPGAWTEGTAITWDGAASAGQVLALDTVNDIVHIQLTLGTAPGNGVVLTDATNTATTLASNATTERPVKGVPCGDSTGSSLVGAYGFALEYLDVQAADLYTALDGTARNPPNNVTFTVGGVAAGWRLLVCDDASGINYTQLSKTGAESGAAITTIVVDEALPDNTPSVAGTKGGIRIQRSDGRYTLHRYTLISETPTTFTIPVTDFSGVGDDIAAGANIFIVFYDKACTGTSETFNTTQVSTQTLYCEARFGGTGPNYTDSIKPAATTGDLVSSGGSATISSVSDE